MGGERKKTNDMGVNNFEFKGGGWQTKWGRVWGDLVVVGGGYCGIVVGGGVKTEQKRGGGSENEKLRSGGGGGPTPKQGGADLELISRGGRLWGIVACSPGHKGHDDDVVPTFLRLDAGGLVWCPAEPLAIYDEGCARCRT